MLTLTKDNIDQVIPLAEMLRDHVDTFNFNRLSQVGEGADLLLPTHDEYVAFLYQYLESAKNNPIMGIKDNLINIIRYQRGVEPFGGCAGYGCSAAFNFVAVLPDGEIHACRKFPSLIGNIFENSFAEIYDSDIAHRYRSGTQACRSCPIRPVCGGCLAVVHGQGLDIFKERDPYCFMNETHS
jgi:selenobiotic family peptide radical SAM maturase